MDHQCSTPSPSSVNLPLPLSPSRLSRSSSSNSTTRMINMNNSRYEASSNLLPRSSSLSSSLSLDTEKAQSHAAAAAVGSSSTSLSSSDAVSPTTLMDAYGRPSIDSFAADLTSERYGKREIYDDDDDEDEDETAFSHHHHHQGLAAPGHIDEDATIRIPPQPSTSASPRLHSPQSLTKKNLPKPPRPPRMRPLSQAISSTSSFDNLHDVDVAPTSSVETALPSHYIGRNDSDTKQHRSTTLMRTVSSRSSSGLTSAPSSSSISSSASSRPASLVVNNSCSTPGVVASPLIDVSSASSSAAASYFAPTPGLTEGQVSHHATYTPIHASVSQEAVKYTHNEETSPQSLGRTLSQRALQRSRSLLRANMGSDDGHHGSGSSNTRASVYTTHTSASDWARERETEMRNSRSGVFDLEYELNNTRSGSSNEGHETSHASPLRERNDEMEEGNASLLADQSAFSTSTSGFIAVSEPPSPPLPKKDKHQLQAQQQALLLTSSTDARLALPHISHASPTSPTSAGYGLGITSDNAIHPVVQPCPTASPDSLESFQDSQHLPAEQSQQQELLSSSLATSPSKSRWSTTRSYVRRNTASSVRSLHKQPSKSSLLDTTGRSPSFPSLQHSSSCTSLSEQYPSSIARYDDTTSTGYNSESDRPPNSSTLSHFGNQASHGQNNILPPLSYADFGSAAGNTRRPPTSQFGSVYASNANSYLSTESLLGDEVEEVQDPQHEDRSGRKRTYEVLPHQRSYNRSDNALHPASAASTRPTSQAVAMAESGKGRVTKVSPEQNVDDLLISHETTHLIFSGVAQPVALGTTLSNALPGLADKLLVLDISSCNLSSMPQSIFLCSNLEELNMSGNFQISGSLPPFISSLVSLRVLLADSCGLNYIAHSFANLRHLHTLALRNNNLKYLPSWFARLSDSLELLLLDDNPFHGDYADLVKPCTQAQPSPTTEVPSPAVAAEATNKEDPAGADSSFATNASVRGNSSESQEQHDLFPPAPIHTVVKSPRTSVLSRASSVRLALHRSFGNADDQATTRSSSSVHSLLLADNSSQASTAKRRAGALKPMKSMGDLSASQPSIHELVSSDQENLHSPFPASPAFPISPSFSDVSTMESDKSQSSRPSPSVLQGQPSFRKSIAGSFAARRSRKSSKGLTALEFIASEVAEARGTQSPPNFPEAVSSLDASPTIGEKAKEVRPGFFKKLSMAARRRKSNSMLNSDLPESSPPPPLPINQGELGLGRPPFLNSGSLRSNSAPDTVGARRTLSMRDNAGELPFPPSMSNLPKSPSGTWQSSLQSSIIEGSRRYRKKSRAPIPETLLELGKAEEETKPAKRRSYLMLNSVLPPVISPGPLTLTFDPTSGEDHTIHAKPALHKIAEEQSPPPTAVPSSIGSPAFNQWSVEKRKAALAPLLAYLRDLDDLSRASDSRHAAESAPIITSRTDSSRIPSRKASSAAVSVVSSLQPDRSSGYESSRADSTGLTSPSSLQGPSSSKVKDDPVRRERVIAEIISSEKSYLASLQDLVTLYIEPASAPLRTSGDGSRETVVPQSERNLVFSVVESITQFHSTVFLPELEKAAIFAGGDRDSSSSLDHAVLRQTAVDIAKVFVDHAAFLKLYHSYTVNFDTALDRCTLWESFKSSSSSAPTSPMSGPNAQKSGLSLTLNQRRRIRHLLKTAKKDPRHTQMSLQSYLLMPIQRIPRYKLLLEALLECTPMADMPDQGEPAIASALESISNLATEMNERKRDNEGRQRLLYWQAQLSRFKAPLVQPHRTVLREGHMLLERVVKRDNAVVANLTASASGANESAASTLIQIPVLKVDRTRRKLIYVLCNDILILVLDMDGTSPITDKYETFTVLRLGKSLGGRDQPASIFGRPDRLRIVEDRAILYLFCPDAESASTCRDLINRQSLQTGLTHRFVDPQA
ncbi:hypothetical protein P389DRAFT_209431 [Cystobasidium minutum MCA 4210]|uniref:uncharacterized protein n=1 Tax=Cystobasidium minutum MCA 4210 TaxID=1397322 RepID=UPI0034CE1F97|eukprot:jgi/Rhomi1/209431/estExt_Genemark1.C_3_t10022